MSVVDEVRQQIRQLFLKGIIQIKESLCLIVHTSCKYHRKIICTVGACSSFGISLPFFLIVSIWRNAMNNSLSRFLVEWLLVSLKESEARDLLEIVEARHQRGSIIFCSQFIPAGWHGKIGESTLADAILDRIVHSSYKITIEGTDSMR